MTRLSDEALADLTSGLALDRRKLIIAGPSLLSEVTETRALVKELVEGLKAIDTIACRHQRGAAGDMQTITRRLLSRARKVQP